VAEACHNPSLDRHAPVTVAEAMVSRPKTLPVEATVADVRGLFDNSHVQTALLVDGERFAGAIDREALPAEAGDGDAAADYAARDGETLTPDTPLALANERLDALETKRLVVLDPDGSTLRGLLCLKGDRSGFCVS
jgi:CBS domain-containing protein